MIVDKNTETSYVLIEAVRTFARSICAFTHVYRGRLKHIKYFLNYSRIIILELWCCVESYSKVPAASIIVLCTTCNIYDYNTQNETNINLE